MKDKEDINPEYWDMSEVWYKYGVTSIKLDLNDKYDEQNDQYDDQEDELIFEPE